MYCTKCGSLNPEDANYCIRCADPMKPSVPPVERKFPSLADDPALRIALPIGRTPLSIVAGYLGIFAIALVPTPFALVTGILAFKELKKHPDKLGRGRAIFGIVMGAIFTVLLVLTILGRHQIF
jgi:hypothetical protein